MDTTEFLQKKNTNVTIFVNIATWPLCSSYYLEFKRLINATFSHFKDFKLILKDN